MKNFPELYKQLKSDKIILYFLSALALFFIADFLIWYQRLRYEDIYVFSLNGIYPIRFLGIISAINCILAFFSYEKEKEIAYLLLGSAIFVSVLIFVLEVYYFANIIYG